MSTSAGLRPTHPDRDWRVSPLYRPLTVDGPIVSWVGCVPAQIDSFRPVSADNTGGDKDLDCDHRASARLRAQFWVLTLTATPFREMFLGRCPPLSILSRLRFPSPDLGKKTPLKLSWDFQANQTNES